MDCVECGQKAITFESHQMDGKTLIETETETKTKHTNWTIEAQREQHELELHFKHLCQQYRNFD